MSDPDSDPDPETETVPDSESAPDSESTFDSENAPGLDPATGSDSSTGSGSTTGSEPDRAAEASSEPPAGDGAGTASDAVPEAARIRRYLNYAVLAGLGLLAAVAAVQFYLHAGTAIARWVAPAYRSLFQAAFNLAVLLVAAAGILRQLDRLSED